MWNMKSVRSDQTAKVVALLKEGWEPFGVVHIKMKKGSGATKDSKVSVDRIYFRMNDTPDEAIEYKTIDPDFIREQLAGIPDRVVEAISQGIDALIEFEKDVIVEREKVLREMREPVAEALPEVEPSEPPQKTQPIIDDPEPDEESEQPRQPVVEPELNDSGVPKGDAFRVVDEAPKENQVILTTSQDAAVEELRKSYENVTLLPRGENGELRVMAESLIYTIDSKGKVEKEDTGANTSSLAV
jgi:hypothetical protein